MTKRKRTGEVYFEQDISTDIMTQDIEQNIGVERHVYPRTVVSVSKYHKKPAKRVGLEQSGPHHHLIEN